MPSSLSSSSSTGSKSLIEERQNSPSARVVEPQRQGGAASSSQPNQRPVSPAIGRKAQLLSQGCTVDQIVIVERALSYIESGHYKESAELLQPMIDRKCSWFFANRFFEAQYENYLALNKPEKAVEVLKKVTEFLKESKNTPFYSIEEKKVAGLFFRQMRGYQQLGQFKNVIQTVDDYIDAVKKPLLLFNVLHMKARAASQLKEYRILSETVDAALRELPPDGAEWIWIDLVNLKIKACCGLEQHRQACDLLVQCYEEAGSRLCSELLGRLGLFLSITEGARRLPISLHSSDKGRVLEPKADQVIDFALHKMTYLSPFFEAFTESKQIVKFIKALLEDEKLGRCLSKGIKARLLMRFAFFLLKDRQLQEAVAIFTQAKADLLHQADPLHKTEAQLVEAAIARESGEYEQALSLLESMNLSRFNSEVERFATESWISLETARTEYAAGRYEDAIRRADSVIESINSLDGSRRENLESFLRELTLIQGKAQRELDRKQGCLGLRSRGDSSLAQSEQFRTLGNLGLALLVEESKKQREAKNYAEAIATANLGLLRDDLTISKEGRIIHAKLLYTKAWSEASLKQYQEAIDTVNSMKDFDGVHGQVKALLYFAKAWAQKQLKQFDAALKTLEQALKLENLDPTTRRQLEGQKCDIEEKRAKSQAAVKEKKGKVKIDDADHRAELEQESKELSIKDASKRTQSTQGITKDRG